MRTEGRAQKEMYQKERESQRGCRKEKVLGMGSQKWIGKKDI